MDKKEKIYLIQCLLEDVRGNWAWDVEERVTLARNLCLELNNDKFNVLAITCSAFLDDCKYGDIDGRFFRNTFPYGYEEMDKLHHLPHTIADKSEEFKTYVRDYITYPDFRFTDWENQ